MSRLLRFGFVLAMLGALAPAVALADSTATIDFEGFAAGTVVSSVSSGSGISGDAIAGSVAVFGISDDFLGENAAVIFDAECGGNAASCSGGDEDLFFPGQGNVLIIDENLVDSDGDGLIDDPDDALGGGQFNFDFTGFGPGVVTVESLWVGDVGDVLGETGEIRLFDGAGLLDTIPLPVLANNEAATVTIGVAGVTRMEVQFVGTGAIDDIVVTVEEDEEGDEGCTPGYWKQSHHFDSWVTYTPDQTLESVFDVPDSLNVDDTTLLQALNFGGGPGVQGGAEILLRAAIASLLNASSGDVNFTMSESEVIDAVNAALASLDRATMLDLASQLDTDNNLGCPLN